jgi:hypothetical protein
MNSIYKKNQYLNHMTNKIIIVNFVIYLKFVNLFPIKYTKNL